MNQPLSAISFGDANLSLIYLNLEPRLVPYDASSGVGSCWRLAWKAGDVVSQIRGLGSNDRFGSKAPFWPYPNHFRSTLNSRHVAAPH